MSDRARTVEKAALHLGSLWKAEPLIPKSSVEATAKIAKVAKTLIRETRALRAALG